MFDITHFEFYKKLNSKSFIEKIILFGSRTNNSFRPNSAIDLAIEASSASEHEWLEVLDIIEDADTLLNIDCIRLDSLSKQSLLRRNIESHGIVVYEKH